MCGEREDPHRRIPAHLWGAAPRGCVLDIAMEVARSLSYTLLHYTLSYKGGRWHTLATCVKCFLLNIECESQRRS